MQRIRNAIVDPSQAYLTVFNSTPLERKLAVLLGIPLNGLDPKLQYLGTKSGSRKIFREAGVKDAMGFEDVRTEADVIAALVELRRRRPGVRRAIIKLNESFSGEGNALCAVPPEPGKELVPETLQSLEFAVPTETHESYFEKLSAMGGVVEEFLDGSQKASPSAQLRTSPDGNVLLISTHDQILGGTHWPDIRRLQLPSSRRVIGSRFRSSDCESAASWRITASSAALAWTSWPRVRPGASRGADAAWRSTCGWSAPRTRSWPSDF